MNSLRLVGRSIALIELVRSLADFMLAPVLLKIAQLYSGNAKFSSGGIEQAIWLALFITLGATILAAALYLIGGSRLPRPDVEAWLKENRPAFESPPLAAAIRDVAEE